MPVNLNEYLKKSILLDNFEDLFEHFETALDKYGYDSVVFICFPPRKFADELLPVCPYFNIPDVIISEYLSNELYRSGPVFEYAKTTGKPVVWSEILQNQKIDKSPEIEKFLKLIQSKGYNNGVTIPVFGVGNSFGYISLASHEKEIDPGVEKNVTLHHLCINLMRQYIRISNDNEKQKHPKLTKREKQVLTWVLKGKSNSVIAELLDISEHTVATYIKRSTKKLNASSKWSAALTAVLIGIIQY